MVGKRHHGSSNMAVLLQSQGMYKEFSGPLFAPGTPSGGSLGSWSLADLKDGHGNSLERPLFRPVELDEIGDDDSGEYPHQPDKKRRLTTCQVQFLEKSFELENKLEPERKLQIAKVLGLKPRQIAVWFQNRRARWKTKQIEKDYESLKSSYDALKMDHDSLVKEKEDLKAEVLSLTKRLLKEENGSLESFEPKRLPDNLQNLDSTLAFEVKKLHGQTMLCKQEDISSANSAILDSESPHHAHEGDCSMLMELNSYSNAFRLHHSDHSQIGDVDDVKHCNFLSPEDTSCGSEFHVAEQVFWLWP
ncbi:homeobox-leucine zipper protein HAT5-like isoform X1 [Musa acuminata AAA Group]|uniref:homeobox-leucine zipper protein HAT5 isoform X1 n=1 Tax=Musa acuminata AAA Group TaxID=214697 RepID=UPI0031D73A24